MSILTRALAATASLVATAIIAVPAYSSDGGDATAKALAWVHANAPEIPDSLVEAACKEGSATFYTTPGRSSVVNKQFEKDIPCLHVTLFKAPGGALAQRFMSEFAAGKYVADAEITSSAVTIDRMVDQHMVGHWVPPTASNVPAAWQRSGYYYTVAANVLTVAWNTAGVSAEQAAQLKKIKTWQDTLKVAGLKGKAAVVNIKAGGTLQTLWSGLYSEYGAGVFKAVADTFDPKVVDSIVPATNQLGAGQIKLIYGAIESIPAALEVLHAPIQWVYPKPYIVTPTLIFISARAPHPNAAKLLEAWYLSKAGMSTYVSDYYQSPIIAGIKDNRPFAKADWFSPPDTTEFKAPDWQKIGKQLPTLVKEFDSAFGVHG